MTNAFDTPDANQLYHQKEDLYDVFGNIVVTVVVPVMRPKPKIICWAGRHFVNQSHAPNIRYIEGDVWHVGSGQEVETDPTPNAEPKQRYDVERERER